MIFSAAEARNFRRSSLSIDPNFSERPPCNSATICFFSAPLSEWLCLIRMLFKSAAWNRRFQRSGPMPVATLTKPRSTRTSVTPPRQDTKLPIRMVPMTMKGVRKIHRKMSMPTPIVSPFMRGAGNHSGTCRPSRCMVEETANRTNIETIPFQNSAAPSKGSAINSERWLAPTSSPMPVGRCQHPCGGWCKSTSGSVALPDTRSEKAWTALHDRQSATSRATLMSSSGMDFPHPGHFGADILQGRLTDHGWFGKPTNTNGSCLGIPLDTQTAERAQTRTKTKRGC